MRDIPPDVVASWPEPNYVNPVTRARAITVVSAVCIPVVVLTFAARLYSRVFVARFFGADDWLMIPSVLSGLVYSCLAIGGEQHGWFKHIWDIPTPTLIAARRLLVPTNLSGLLNVGFTKLSVLALYLRLAPPSRFQVSVFATIGLTSAWLLSLIVTTFLMCVPLHAYWDVNYDNGQTCFAEVPYYVAFAGIDLVLDMIVYLLPLPALMRLHLPRRQKLILVGVFGLGIIVIAASAMRLPSIFRVSKSYDLTWELFDAVLWMEVASTVGIICASVPALKPLVRKYRPAALGLQTQTNPNAPSCVQRTETVVSRRTAAFPRGRASDGSGVVDDVELYPGGLDMMDLDLDEWNIAKFPDSQGDLIYEEPLEDADGIERR